LGELIGLPEWLFATLFVAVGLGGWLGLGFLLHRRGRKRLAAKRPNPTRDQFIAMLVADVDADIAAWLWDQALPYYDPLTPHPDDHLLDDAMIDDDDIAMDWCRDFTEVMVLDEKSFPEWPDGWTLTVRNYARWLQLARQAQG
jgi:hypothetical protein